MCPWWLQTTALGIARARERDLQCKLLGTTERYIFQNNSSRKKSINLETVLVCSGALPIPQARIPHPVQQLAELSVMRRTVLCWDPLLQVPDAGPCGKGQIHHHVSIRVFYLTGLSPVFSWGKASETQRQHKERPSLQFPSCFGTEFCSWLKFFSFQNTGGRFFMKTRNSAKERHKI